MTRYLSGLCVAGLGLCGGGWLLVAAEAFGGHGGEARLVNEATGAGLMLAACVTLVAWAVAWRQRMRADGVFGEQFLLVPRREARRNRRELAKDIRRTARQSKREARQARREPEQPDILPDDELVEEPTYLGITVYEPAPDAHPGSGREPADRGASGAAPNDTEFEGAEPAGFRPDRYHGGHDGASAVDGADVLGELRTLRGLLAPLLAQTAGAALDPSVRSETQRAVPPQSDRPEQPEQPEQPERPEQPWFGAPPMAVDVDLQRVADSEEAWW